MARVICIGDIHGCLQEFKELLHQVSFVRGTDRLVLVGDLMDRGPFPVECVRLARELGAESVLGNHEEAHIRFRKHEAKRAATGKKNPMKPFTEVRAQQSLALSDEDLAWFNDMPQILQIADNLLVVHAGFEPAFPASQQSSAVIRVRYVDPDGEMVGYEEGSLEQPANTVYWATRWTGPESVIYGHAVHSFEDPRVDVFIGGACYGIDTGCTFGGRLTAAIVIDGRVTDFVQVQAHERYYTSAYYHRHG
jgi:bis(5'-nucleosyl)-tetraphosphatase (symmetrical)